MTPTGGSLIPIKLKLLQSGGSRENLFFLNNRGHLKWLIQQTTLQQLQSSVT